MIDQSLNGVAFLLIFANPLDRNPVIAAGDLRIAQLLKVLTDTSKLLRGAPWA